MLGAFIAPAEMAAWSQVAVLTTVDEVTGGSVLVEVRPLVVDVAFDADSVVVVDRDADGLLEQPARTIAPSAAVTTIRVPSHLRMHEPPDRSANGPAC